MEEFDLFNVSHLILLSTVILLSGTYPAYVEKLISNKPSLFVVFTPIKISAYKSLKLVVPLYFTTRKSELANKLILSVIDFVYEI